MNGKPRERKGKGKRKEVLPLAAPSQAGSDFRLLHHSFSIRPSPFPLTRSLTPFHLLPFPSRPTRTGVFLVQAFPALQSPCAFWQGQPGLVNVSLHSVPKFADVERSLACLAGDGFLRRASLAGKKILGILPDPCFRALTYII